MSVWLYGLTTSGGGTTASGVTVYVALGGGIYRQETTEANAQIKLRGVYSIGTDGLQANIASITGTLTMRTRKNSANGNLTLSITTSGYKESAGTGDTFADGDLANLQLVMSGGHSDTVLINTLGVGINDGGNNTQMLVAKGSSTWGPANALQYAHILGILNGSVTESDRQIKFYDAATLSNFQLNITAISGTHTFRVRKNSANGNQVISASTTGFKEDITNTDSISVNDLVNLVHEAGGTSVSVSIAALKNSCTVGYQGISTGGSGQVFSTASTAAYIPIGSALGTLNTTESTFQLKPRSSKRWSQMQARVTANTRSDTTTVDLRSNAASTAASISIATGTTGLREDASGFADISATDLINYRVLLGAGSGSITFTTLGAKEEAQPAPTLIYSNLESMFRGMSRGMGPT